MAQFCLKGSLDTLCRGVNNNYKVRIAVREDCGKSGVVVTSIKFCRVKCEVSIDLQIKWTVGCMSLELKKEVWVGDNKSLRVIEVYMV